MLAAIIEELSRLDAEEIRVTLDYEFAPETGPLVRVERDAAYWHLPPEHFLALLKALPQGVGHRRGWRLIGRHLCPRRCYKGG